jgi:hypothetical protein
VYPGVYAVGRPPVTSLECAAAAVLACGPGAGLAHASSLSLWGVEKDWRTPFEVVVAGDRRPKGIRAHRLRNLHRRDLTIQLGIRATTLARALLDTAPRLSQKRLTRAVNDSLHSRYMFPSHLQDVLERNPHHQGAPLLIPFLAKTTMGITRSELEDMFVAFCERYGLPTPLTNVKLAGYTVDAYFPDHGVIVEIDSWDFHKDRASFEDNRDRDADTLAAGLITVRITDRRMKHTPEEEATRLHRILQRAEKRRQKSGPGSEADDDEPRGEQHEREPQR